MPWINDKIYIETDLRHLTDSDLCTRAGHIHYYYRDYKKPEITYDLPDVAEMEQTKTAFCRLAYMTGPYYAQGRLSRKELAGYRKELLHLRKKLLGFTEQWGIHCVIEIIAGRLRHYDTGFGYFDLDSARKPGPTTSFWVQVDREKGIFRMECQKKPAILTWFHWEASEDGGATWIKLGKTRYPHHSTKKPDLNKPYCFRMYASNPKGKSGEAFWEYRG